MPLDRRGFLALTGAFLATPALAADRADLCRTALLDWYRLVLELVRHTATYSPPVAARAFAYVGIIAHESHVGLIPGPVTLAGQLNGLTALPAPAPGLDPAAVLDAALGKAMADYFGNTGPSGQGAMQAMVRRLAERIDADLPPELAAKSRAHGVAIADHVWNWSLSDGGAVVENLGFPYDYTFGENPKDWVPTSDIRIQQAPLLPNWGANRPFAMPSTAACTIPAHPDFSTEPGSAFHAAAMEVYEVSKSLTAEQIEIARFWSDDPMLSPTPPGHWVSIVLQIAERDRMPAERTAAALAVLGVAIADGFIGCWAEKYRWNLVRPVTYIKRYIDPNWETLLITPPFPEYPSGHSVQSGAAAVALTAFFGEDFAFEDATHADDGLAVRRFASFHEAAEEAAISRLYGGIHYRFGNEQGLVQGRCIGAHAARLKTFA
ncbi:vanadium-dependent haloperoxidase [Tabrizicola thermarum]|uniref:vanadium-dependent haloperoxidase n=1 Tax=Tabrizicola thermarum TaxID=2670345 RepID=UPI000FFC925F|nr:vanadium-dependent haloperoxidase [Tabrizicola thermarum]